MTAVELDDVVVQRGAARILDGISCTIPAGRVTGLLGPSGSGKTTLLRTIVGVQAVRSGTVTVLGQPAGSAALRDSVGYVTQAPSVYADLTVRENARYFAALYGCSAADADRAVADVDLTAAADRLVGALSGGQRSRASLACALLAAPALLILDEPTVGQDPVLRRELWDQFRALADAGTTVIVSSHVMDEAARCDELLLIRAGRLLAQGTPAALRTAAGADDFEDVFLRLIDAAQDKDAA
jgi:ABC-2 type transport system ATP-binding protein